TVWFLLHDPEHGITFSTIPETVNLISQHKLVSIHFYYYYYYYYYYYSFASGSDKDESKLH
ncbi:MAG: hypothetical protein K7J15_03310, partial [Candidatus Regiella insecticola]|nr:hypothetical protein [Candidatus Regiella insecticola]MCX2959325.1 hypothetical protein [Serratia symbiotica]